MENGYGGPVWHASAALQRPEGLAPVATLHINQAVDMLLRLRDALAGVGDPALGEWTEHLERSIHIKRRLTAEEWGGKPWGMDYRRTPEGLARIEAIARTLPAEWRGRLLVEVQ